jgi:hypothetical protein
MKHRVRLLATVFSASLLLSACGGGSNSVNAPPPPPAADLSTGPQACVGGNAGDFACLGVSLRARVPHGDLGGTSGNDIWGWADTTTGNEYALVGMTDGTAFVDVTDPENPVFLGRLPTATSASSWRDIKVYQDHAYIVADAAGAHGMQVFDLTRLRGVVAPQNFTADASYNDFANAHNLAINEDTGFHDAQCVSYVGPDVDYAGREICASSAENIVEIVDVSNKAAPVTVSISTYPQLGFVHQAWLTEDHQFLLVGDEFDEGNFGVPTRTHVFDVSDLDAPVYVFAYEGPTTTIDHNLYVRGNRVFEANYMSGLRVIEFGDLANQEMTEVAFFDTYPQSDATQFDGAWSVYPYLPSGNVIVNDISNGLFVLTVQ